MVGYACRPIPVGQRGPPVGNFASRTHNQPGQNSLRTELSAESFPPQSSFLPPVLSQKSDQRQKVHLKALPAYSLAPPFILPRCPCAKSPAHTIPSWLCFPEDMNEHNTFESRKKKSLFNWVCSDLIILKIFGHTTFTTLYQYLTPDCIKGLFREFFKRSFP